MTGRYARRLQYAAAGVTFGAYAGLSHYSNAVGNLPNLGAAVALTPLTALALILFWRSTPRPVAILLTALLGAAIYALWPLLASNYPLFSLIQESAVYVLLSLTFSASLLAGQTALCTRLADKVHGPLTSLEVLYTRRVTAVWASFFVAVAMLSIALFAETALRIWSFYINFCVPALIVVMFAVEYSVRRRVLPHVKRIGVIATMRVYFTSPKVS